MDLNCGLADILDTHGENKKAFFSKESHFRMW